MSTKLYTKGSKEYKAFHSRFDHLTTDIKKSLFESCTGDLDLDTLNDTIRRVWWVLCDHKWIFDIYPLHAHKNKVLSVLASIAIFVYLPEKIFIYKDHFTLISDDYGVKVRVYENKIKVYRDNEYFAGYCFDLCEWDIDPELLQWLD